MGCAIPVQDIQGMEWKSRSGELQRTGVLLFARWGQVSGIKSALCFCLFDEFHDRIRQRSAAFS